MNINPLMLKLIFPNKEYVKFLPEVKTSAITQGSELHPDGLYSVESFGQLGTDKRYEQFGYIDIYTELIHPRIYYYITTLSSFHKKIIEGKVYARWDTTTKTFVQDKDGGETGYTFFLNHLYQLDFGSSDSDDRQNMINVINKYRKRGLLTNNKILVIPAGLRDVDIDADGRITEIDINDDYKAIINTANLLKSINAHGSANDFILLQLQEKVQTMMDNLFKLINGKKKLLRGHWTTRNIEFGTRNVATGKGLIIEDLRKSNDDTINTASVALIQYLKAIDPVAKFCVTSKFTNDIFNEIDLTARLYNPKSNKYEIVNVNEKTVNEWITSRGLDNVLNRMIDIDFINSPIEIDGMWLLAVEDLGDRIIIKEPGYEDDSNVRCITYGELFYISIYNEIDRIHGTITRYPITEQGSIIPVKVRVNTTVENRVVRVEKGDIDHTKSIPEPSLMINYPKLNSYYDTTIAPSPTAMDGLGLDMDGDKISFQAILSDEANAEIEEFLNSPRNYIDPSGTPIKVLEDKVAQMTALFLTRRP
jgi:hypothetical protein